MDTTTRVPAAPAAPDDDPWATLAEPEAPALPTTGGVVRPTMPWDAPDLTGAADTTPAPVPTRAPGPVPTAVAASPPEVSFPPGVAAKLAVYVYLLVDARTGRPFLVARGRGDRCFRHVEAARAGAAAVPPTGAAGRRPRRWARPSSPPWTASARPSPTAGRCGWRSCATG